MIHFTGTCKYTLAASTKGARYVFAIEVNNKRGGNTWLSYTREIDIKLKRVTIRLLPGNTMLVRTHYKFKKSLNIYIMTN